MGEYRLPLHTGRFTITTELSGFAPVARTVELLIGQNACHDGFC
jgi:hypothetical protein